MRIFYHAIMATGLAAATAIPAFAASHDTDMAKATCGEFAAMDTEGQMAAMDAMHMAADEMASDEMSSDAMASDDSSTEEMASDDAATDDMASDDMMAEEMTEIAAVCDGKPDVMVMDAMMSSDG